ncbi:MAG: roadblock/LC7 domain-containing protein [Candidatus Njordarchaeia archaeon]
MPATLSYKKRFESILNELLSNAADIHGTILVRYDGLLIASSVKERADKDLIASISTALVNISRRTSEELKKGVYDYTIVAASDGNIVTVDVGERGALVSLTKKDANLGLVLLQMRRANKKLQEIFNDLFS